MVFCKKPWDPNREYRINLFVNRNLGSLLQRGDPICGRFFTLVFSLTKSGLNRRSNNFLTLFAFPTTTLHKPKSPLRISANPEPAEGTKHNFGSSWDPHIPIHPLSIYTIEKLSSVLSFVINSPSIEPFRLSSRGISRAGRLHPFRGGADFVIIARTSPGSPRSPCVRETSLSNRKLSSLLSSQADVNSLNKIFRFQIDLSEKRLSFFSLFEQVIGDIQCR